MVVIAAAWMNSRRRKIELLVGNFRRTDIRGFLDQHVLLKHHYRAKGCRLGLRCMQVVYLHGFASSPQSSKAQFFAERFAARGVTFLCPDFNQPDFSTLTVSRMLQQLEERIAALPPGDVVLIGSSLGGFVAVEAAARQVSQARHPISRLVLLAPAVELEWERWSELGAGRNRAVATNRAASTCFTTRRTRRSDSTSSSTKTLEQYRPAARRLNLPVLIFQGRHDDSVSPAIVERFARAQANATLHLLEDGHQLKNSLEFIWLETPDFWLEPS